ncbi:MAG: S8 family serine peptidase [Acidobacteriota bacterium]|nr:S8 family serine peptidase [Acidobacteriota bacterium]
MSSSHSFPDLRLYRMLWLAIAALLVLFFVLVPGALGAQEELDPFQELLIKKTDFDTETRAAVTQGESVEVLVTFRDRDEDAAGMLRQSVDEEEGLQAQLEYRSAVWGLFKGAVLQDLEQQDLAVEVTRDFDYLPVTVVQIQSPEQAEALLSHPDVLGLSQNRWYEPMVSKSLPLINHQGALNVVHGSGSQLGAHSSVVVIDSGVDYTLPTFGSCEAAGEEGCVVSYARDFAPEDGELDNTGHGTNVAGIVHAVAPGAKIISLDVFRDVGGGVQRASRDDIIAAIDWALRNTYWHKIKAINLSLGSPRRFNVCAAASTFSPYHSAFELLYQYGIMPVVASGNEADPNQVTDPACAPKAVAVGSVLDTDITFLNHQNFFYGSCWENPGTPKDTVSCFSNGGPELDLLAPGDKITAAGITTQGTSQAAPHVAGAAAVLRSYYRWESIPETLARMTRSGTPITDHRTGEVYPRLDLGAALQVDPCELNSLAPGCVLGRDDCGQRFDGAICEQFRDVIFDLCLVKPWICVEPWPTEPLQDFDPERFRGRRF